jgi:mRNA interferase MazF
VLSPESYNERVGLAIFCPITTVAKGYPFEVPLPTESRVRGVVLSDQVKSLDWRARGVDLIEVLPAGVTDEVLQKLGTLLD